MRDDGSAPQVTEANTYASLDFWQWPGKRCKWSNRIVLGHFRMWQFSSNPGTLVKVPWTILPVPMSTSEHWLTEKDILHIVLHPTEWEWRPRSFLWTINSRDYRRQNKRASRGSPYRAPGCLADVDAVCWSAVCPVQQHHMVGSWSSVSSIQKYGHRLLTWVTAPSV